MTQTAIKPSALGWQVFDMWGNSRFYKEDPRPIGAIERSYRGLHLPTGTVHPGSSLFASEAAFETTMAHWNAQGGSTWKYTKEDPR